MASNNIVSLWLRLLSLSLILTLVFSMPLNPKKTYSRFNVGAYMKAMKLKRECVATNHQDILNKEQEVNKIQSKLNRLASKASGLGAKVNALQKGTSHQKSGEHRSGTFLSDISVSRRRKLPTSINGTGQLMSTRTKKRRLQETVQAALEIHGGTENNPEPAVAGMVHALSSSVSRDSVVSAVCEKTKLAEDITSKFYGSSCTAYEQSDNNLLRSVAVYYEMGVMGKRKYMKARRSFSFKNACSPWKKTTRIKIAKCSIPALVPYYKLAKFLNGISLGTLHSVESLCENSPDKLIVNGYYRDLQEFLPRLAENTYPEKHFNWFESPYTFKVAIGGDGAPLGKHDQSCAWLVSFLNIGKLFLSSEHNFLIFGANCSENCQAVEVYVSKLISDIAHLEKNVFTIKGKHVRFEFSEIPNDMKMLCFLAGELSNSAQYFSTFGSVSYNNMSNIHCTFGPHENNNWQPWDYEKRLSVVKQVENLKKKLDKTKIAEKTKRSKITSFIAEKKSRQEYVPRIGKLIDKAHVEPLHLKNNACALMFRYILDFAIAKSHLPPSVSTFSSVDPQSSFSKLISSMRSVSNLSRLAKKVVKWFDETKASTKSFDYRFTGQESRRFLHNFMNLISAIEVENDPEPARFKLHVLAFATLSLREAVSLFNRFDVRREQLDKLERACNDFYSCCALFLQVNPTVWTLGRVVPVHARDVFQKYGKGLIINSMEGREAKHQAIARYAKKSTYCNRWYSIFRHKFISLIWLRERGYNLATSKTCNTTYVPKHVLEDKLYCYCGLTPFEGKCKYCKHTYREKVRSSIQGKKVEKGLLKI